MTARHALLLCALLLPACGQASQSSSANQTAAPAPSNKPQGSAQISYSFDMRYELASAKIEKLQQDHATLCRTLGPTRCVVLDTNLRRDGDDVSGGETAMIVAAPMATAFTARLDRAVTDADGRVASRKSSAEDVTRQVVDTDARVRAKQALADRLLGLIQSRQGSVADLVAAEKAYADVQEELDAARSLQATLRQRVAMSRIDIDYAATDDVGLFGPLRHALGSAGGTLGFSLGLLVSFVVAGAPWLLLFVALAWVWRRMGWRGWLARWRRPRGD